MTKIIERDIIRELENNASVFVFHSEIAAASWLARTLRISGRKALPLNRFISWDAFKRKVFEGERTERPSSRVLRTIFSRDLLSRNRDAPFLRHIIPHDRNEFSLGFTRHLAAALPSLHSLPKTGTPLVDEWKVIRELYAEFLDSHGLYEASWLERRASDVTNKYFLFYPDLTEDWNEYSQAVEGIPRAELRLCHRENHKPIFAAKFSTTLQEIRAVLVKIRQAVLAGTDPSEITISVASPQAMIPVLSREARIAGIPLDIREAKPLSISSGGKLLHDLLDVATSTCSFDSIQRLILDKSRTFADPLGARALVDTGLRKHVIAPIPGASGDIWERSMDRSAPKKVINLYRRIKNGAAALAEATSFLKVRQAFDSFRKACLDETMLTKIQDDEIARCVILLDELHEAAETVGVSRIEKAAELFYQQLQETKYLPISAETGIAVYKFPVAAASFPALHFVLNVSENAAVALSRPLGFLRDDERELASVSDTDISAGLLRLLSTSGETVFMSFAEQGPEGVRPPHPALEALPPEEIPWNYAFTDWLPNLDGNPVHKHAKKNHAFPLQKKSAQAASAAACRMPGPDFAGAKKINAAFLPRAVCESIIDLQSSDGFLRLSDSSIEAYLSCPFKRIFSSSFHLKPIVSGLSFIDSLMIGSVYHDTLALLFGELAVNGASIVDAVDEGETARPGDKNLSAYLDVTIRSFEQKNGPFPALMLQSMRPALVKNLELSLVGLRRILDSCIPLYADSDFFSLDIADCKVRLTGRPDLVCEKTTANAERVEKTVLLLDYKKNKMPAKNQLMLSETGTMEKIQMPIYAMLLEAMSHKIEAAIYFSIEEKTLSRKTCVAIGTGKKSVSQIEDLPRLKDAVMASCASTAKIVRTGAIYTPSAAEQETVCENCDLRPVCRERYTVR